MGEQLALFGGQPAVGAATFPIWPKVSAEEIEAVVALLSCNTLSIYDRSSIYAEFEDRFAAYHGRQYALAHNSGTSALHAAFFAAGVGPGDEVLAPTYTFLATVTPIFQTGATPVLCEMDGETLNIDPADAARRVTPRTRALVVTHMWGHPCEMAPLRKLADDHGLVLIEDCSHAHGATYGGQKVGTFGHLACFSLEGHKAVHAGEGGVLLTDDRAYYERAILLGHFGRRAKDELTLDALYRYRETGLGQKYRIHPVGAAIANVRLQSLDRENLVRWDNMTWFSARIAGIPGLRPPVTHAHCTRGGWYGYKPLYQPDELSGLPMDRYLTALQAEGVPMKTPGSKPLHLLPLFQDDPAAIRRLGSNWRGLASTRAAPYRDGDFPMAEERYARLLSFPVFAEPARELLELCAQALEKVGRYFHQHGPG